MFHSCKPMSTSHKHLQHKLDTQFQVSLYNAQPEGSPQSYLNSIPTPYAVSNNSCPFITGKQSILSSCAHWGWIGSKAEPVVSNI